MIELRNVNKGFASGSYRVEILKDFNLQVKTGEYLGIMGPSGSGKSTLLALMSGLLQPDRGEVVIGDQLLSQFSSDKATKFRGSNIAYIFQTFELVPTLTVRENIELPLDINRLVPAAFSVEAILDRVGLAGKENRYPDALSGGEKQRVAIARAFIGRLPYLFADEPTGNLDRKNAEKIMDLIGELHRETHNTIVMITHDPAVAKRADRIVEMKGE